MPPIMGAGAFVMASYTQIPYLQIIAVSALPAALYYLTVMYFVRIEAQRLGLTPNPGAQDESIWQVLAQGRHFIIPLGLLVGLLIAGYTPIRAAIVSTIAVVGASWISSTPMKLSDIFDAMVDGVQTMISTALLLVALSPELLTGMLLSAHLIIFCLSQDSNVMPPICLAAFAAAAIAGTKPIATGLTSWKLAKGLYLVPVLFAYSPLISGTWPERFNTFFWSCLGLYAIAGLLQWRLERRLNLVSAALLGASGALLLWAPFTVYHHMVGAAILFGVIYWQRYQRKTAAPVATP